MFTTDDVEFVWEPDSEVDSSDHSDELPAYALWTVQAFNHDGKALSAPYGACDFGRDVSPWAEESTEYRLSIEESVLDELNGTTRNLYDPFNAAATFGRTREGNDFPCITIGGVEVYAFFNEFGVLVVSVDPDGADPAVQDAKGRVCVQFRGAVG
jgi:hypothetical protein